MYVSERTMYVLYVSICRSLLFAPYLAMFEHFVRGDCEEGNLIVWLVFLILVLVIFTILSH